VHGYNASLFAYGQTSSGKSFTMMGVPGTSASGLLPRLVRLLFRALESCSDEQPGSALHTGRETLVEASFIEIYNEKLRGTN
jgi:hypothetical protein